MKIQKGGPNYCLAYNFGIMHHTISALAHFKVVYSMDLLAIVKYIYDSNNHVDVQELLHQKDYLYSTET